MPFLQSDTQNGPKMKEVKTGSTTFNLKKITKVVRGWRGMDNLSNFFYANNKYQATNHQQIEGCNNENDLMYLTFLRLDGTQIRKSFQNMIELNSVGL